MLKYLCFAYYFISGILNAPYQPMYIIQHGLSLVGLSAHKKQGHIESIYMDGSIINFLMFRKRDLSLYTRTHETHEVVDKIHNALHTSPNPHLFYMLSNIRLPWNMKLIFEKPTIE
jgi:hypothetical protein